MISIPGVTSPGSLAGALVNHTTFQISMGADAGALVDVTALLPPMSLLKIHYIDPISWEADTIDLIFTDIKDQIINNSKIKKGVWMKVTINQFGKDYPGSHTQRALGTFMIDQIKQSGPPTQTTLMASSLPIDSQIKYTLKNQTRFTTDLKGLAQDVATENGLKLDWQATEVQGQRQLDQAEQWNETDLQMLIKYLKSNALCMKIKDGKIIVFDEQAWEQKPAVYTIDWSKPGAGMEMTNWELTTQSQDIYSQAQLAYFDPSTGQYYIGQAPAPEGAAEGSSESLNVYDHPALTKASGGEDVAGSA